MIQRIFKHFLWVLLAIAGAQSSIAQNVNIKASFDSVAILIGDQIFFNLVAEQPTTAKIEFPVFADSIIDKIEVLSSVPPDTVYLSPQTIRVIRKYLVTSFDSGDYKVDFIKMPYTNNGLTDTAYSNALMLYVRAIPIQEPDKIADIKPVIQLPYTFKEIATYIAIGLGILLLIAALLYVIIRWRQKKPIFNLPKKPVEPPHVIAFRMLELLKGEKLWQQGQYKQYYSRLTDILRAYIEARFLVPAMESTTDEILIELKNNQAIDAKLKELLRATLSDADLVKFAKAEPLASDNENAWAFVYDFVSQTYQVPEQQKNDTGLENSQAQIDQ